MTTQPDVFALLVVNHYRQLRAAAEQHRQIAERHTPPDRPGTIHDHPETEEELS